jgi:hypothetical protein
MVWCGVPVNDEILVTRRWLSEVGLTEREHARAPKIPRV